MRFFFRFHKWFELSFVHIFNHLKQLFHWKTAKSSLINKLHALLVIVKLIHPCFFIFINIQKNFCFFRVFYSTSSILLMTRQSVHCIIRMKLILARLLPSKILIKRVSAKIEILVIMFRCILMRWMLLINNRTVAFFKSCFDKIKIKVNLHKICYQKGKVLELYWFGFVTSDSCVILAKCELVQLPRPTFQKFLPKLC